MSARVHHRHGGYTLGQAAAVLGIKPADLKRYEEEGRITPTRTPGGHRRYDPADIDRLHAEETAR